MEETVIKHYLFKTLIFAFLSVTYCISVVANDNTVLIPVEVEDTIVKVPIARGIDHTKKKLVIKQLTKSDNFPLLRIKGGFIDAFLGECKKAQRTVCLDENCKVDYDKSTTGGKGYVQTGGLIHGYLEQKIHVINGICLTSTVEACRQSFFRSGAKYQAHHIIYGKCAYFE